MKVNNDDAAHVHELVMYSPMLHASTESRGDSTKLER